MILGIDEVGRGPWAGPLVVGAVVLNVPIEGLTDSKKLTKKRRLELNDSILKDSAGWGLGWVSNKEIDTIGLSEALRLATRRAVEQITAPYHEIIIDGTINFLSNTPKGAYVTTLKKADLLIPAISAASIIAKVARDTYMMQQDTIYPGYSFGSHVGYGTAAHQAAIQRFGVTPLHRTSFAPIAALIGETEPNTIMRNKVSTTYTGMKAEKEVARYLQKNGHILLDRNWSTRYCEIDIVSIHKGRLVCTEVKYRSSNGQGGGIAAITRAKRKRMEQAAEAYVQKSQRSFSDRLLAVAEVTREGRITYLELGESLADEGTIASY
tara:strand:+ start:618 stop:1586 length:969 start_codon:yes stop_codon:yes gene_type:complete